MGTRGRTDSELMAAQDEPTGARGRAERRRTARRAARKRKRSLLREIPLIAVVALLIALTLKTFFLQVFVIPSGSMEQTIRIGDRVLVDKLTPWFGSEPQRGDVVVFKDPGGWLENDRKPATDGPLTSGFKQVFSYVGLLPSSSEQDLIKRVVGVGGDTVVCCDTQGRITVNGTAINEPYLAPGNVPSRIPFQVKVPQGRLWVMGDHRDLSADSRYHMGNPGQGTVPLSDVIGRAFMIAWPLGRFQQLPAGPAATSALGQGATSGFGVTPALGTATVRAGPGRQPQSVAARPDLMEPSLVMGVLGVFPPVRRRRLPTVLAATPCGRTRSGHLE